MKCFITLNRVYRELFIINKYPYLKSCPRSLYFLYHIKQFKPILHTLLNYITLKYKVTYTYMSDRYEHCVTICYPGVYDFL